MTNKGDAHGVGMNQSADILVVENGRFPQQNEFN